MSFIIQKVDQFSKIKGITKDLIRKRHGRERRIPKKIFVEEGHPRKGLLPIAATGDEREIQKRKISDLERSIKSYWNCGRKKRGGLAGKGLLGSGGKRSGKEVLYLDDGRCTKVKGVGRGSLATVRRKREAS